MILLQSNPKHRRLSMTREAAWEAYPCPPTSSHVGDPSSSSVLLCPLPYLRGRHGRKTLIVSHKRRATRLEQRIGLPESEDCELEGPMAAGRFHRKAVLALLRSQRRGEW